VLGRWGPVGPPTSGNQPALDQAHGEGEREGAGGDDANADEDEIGCEELRRGRDEMADAARRGDPDPGSGTGGIRDPVTLYWDPGIPGIR